jgi:hypothetical protein
VIGRSNACDYAIPIRPCPLGTRSSCASTTAGRFAIWGSRNGTRVNGWLATEEPLHAGDTLTLGMTEFVFEP